MKCLSDEEIIQYLSVDDTSPESMELVSRVHAHERECPSCRERLEASRSVFAQMGRLRRPVTEPEVIRGIIQVIHGVDKKVLDKKSKSRLMEEQER